MNLECDILTIDLMCNLNESLFLRLIIDFICCGCILPFLKELLNIGESQITSLECGGHNDYGSVL